MRVSVLWPERRAPRRAALWLALAIGAAAGSAARAEDPPRIVCDTPIFEFGRRRPGEGEIRHVFVLRNEGGAPLEIVDVRSLCDCADVAIGARLLMPGDTTELRATLPLRGRRGRIDAAILVLSNDPATPALRLGFRGEIEPPVALHPLSLLLGEVERHERVEGAVDVTLAPERPGRVVAAVSDSPRFAAAIEEVTPGRHYRVRVHTVPPLDGPGSMLRADVRIDIDDGSAYRIPVIATRTDAVLVAPEQILLPAGSRGRVTRFISVRPGRARAMRVLSAEGPEGTRVHVEDAGARGVQVRVDIERVHAALDGKAVRIVTDVDGAEEIRIPFRVVYPTRRR